MAAEEAKAKYSSPECESCRTVVEQFYKGWFSQTHVSCEGCPHADTPSFYPPDRGTIFSRRREKVVHGLAANGTFESRAGAAPKITYNQVES